MTFDLVMIEARDAQGIVRAMAIYQNGYWWFFGPGGDEW